MIIKTGFSLAGKKQMMVDMITIDRLRFEDLNGLKRLYDDAFEGSVTNMDRLTETYHTVKDNPHYVVLCAKSGNEIVGSVLGIICNELFGNCQPFMVLEDVAVLSSYRRQGIGQLLLQSMEDHARQYHCTMILFVSSKHRTGAHRVYE